MWCFRQLSLRQYFYEWQLEQILILRHMVLLSEISKKYQRGFRTRDWVEASRILRIMVEKINSFEWTVSIILQKNIIQPEKQWSSDTGYKMNFVSDMLGEISEVQTRKDYMILLTQCLNLLTGRFINYWFQSSCFGRCRSFGNGVVVAQYLNVIMLLSQTLKNG